MPQLLLGPVSIGDYPCLRVSTYVSKLELQLFDLCCVHWQWQKDWKPSIQIRVRAVHILQVQFQIVCLCMIERLPSIIVFVVAQCCVIFCLPLQTTSSWVTEKMGVVVRSIITFFICTFQKGFCDFTSLKCCQYSWLECNCAVKYYSGFQSVSEGLEICSFLFRCITLKLPKTLIALRSKELSQSS